MKVAAIKKLVENVSMEQLLQAEQDLIDEKQLQIIVDGEDEGEQLTHIIAAAWILEKMNGQNMDFTFALREYTKKVRESIN